jgi:general secretion pathway protein M
VERLRRIRADLEAQLARLSPRERLLVTAAAAAAAALLLLGVGLAVSRSVRAREDRIAEKTQVLSQVGTLAQGFRRAQSERAVLEAKLRGPPVALMSLVSQTGARLGIEVNDLRPGGAGPAAGERAGGGGDKVVEESVEVNLARLDLPRLAALLAELERSPGVVRVRRLALRGRSDDPASVDVTLVISAWQLRG